MPAGQAPTTAPGTCLWAIEDAGFIHVIPDIKVFCGAPVLVKRKLAGPPSLDVRVEHV